ncbi:CsbD family protein [Leuconostoc mesenteroides]|uniref:CsbD family protein n=1 Tax=Leuconostoc mesenteroides TaxID=1245 RepID=UPI00068258AD|nr:CsbD family protein [Leuconostoc mesenteroides]ARR89384.1 CsbD family protein [Leuconostoc mesenteroides subsp. mesenteroides]KMY79756.1 general stress protein CsbD [Leuconostoc mesenteroides subsp. cremoris]MCT3050744.1 CsbD family protein [Leuconostoc mesenteroides]ORI79512.1 CsbD family protein [Leuconostoc mesenteroides subsp. mesenteroides]TLP95121.1 CsbD family protein [Leuconostoc mesenteroides]
MSFEEKFDNAKDKIAGKAQELGGKITGDKAREVEGKTQNVKGEAKDDVQKVRDVAHDDVDAVKDALKNKKDNPEK